MIDHIKALITGAATADGTATDDVPAAAAALVIEAAVLDGEFDTDERRTIARLLAERFDLEASEVESLIEQGMEAVAHSVDLYGFTRVLKDGLPHEERGWIIEMLWEVAYADGKLHDYEANLVRRIVGLLHVPDRESGAARKRVLERLDIGGPIA